MKQIFKFFAALMFVGATMGMVACDKNDPKPDDPTPEPQPQEQTLVGTSWSGDCPDAGVFNYQGQDLPVSMTLDIQFAQSTATMILGMNISAQSSTLNCSWSESNGNGTLTIQGNSVAFVWDATNNTITFDGLYFGIAASQDEAPQSLGGRFVLYKN